MDFRGGVEVQAAFRHPEPHFSGVFSGVDFSQFTKRRTRKCTFFTCGCHLSVVCRSFDIHTTDFSVQFH